MPTDDNAGQEAAQDGQGDIAGQEAGQQMRADGQSAKPDQTGQEAAGGKRNVDSLWDEIISLREENKKWREKLRKEEQERLAAQGNWQEIAERRQKEADELKPYQERAKQLEERLRAINETRIQQIPEAMRDLVPADELPPERLAEWLDKHGSKLMRPIAPQTDAGAGAGAGGGSAVSLTEDERLIAKQMGMTDEDYAKYKKR